MRIVLASGGRMRKAILETLQGSGHEIVGYLADCTTLWPGEKRLLPLAWRLSDLGRKCARKVPVYWLTPEFQERPQAVTALSPDLILVAGFRTILRMNLLRSPSVACLNIHPSLLPRHRGPDPISHTILSGDTESGIDHEAAGT